MGNYKLLSDQESHTVFIYRESKRINVKNIYPVLKYFKIVLGLSQSIQNNSLRNSGAKYVGNKMPSQIQNFSVCLGNASAKKTVEDLAETFVYHIGNSFGIPPHFSKD